MNKEELILKGEETLKKEIEYVKNIIVAKMNKDNDTNMYYEQYKKLSDDTNTLVNDYFQNGYELEDNYKSKFCELLLDCQEYINLLSLKTQLDKKGPILDYLIHSKRKVISITSYLLELELLKTTWWFFETQDYNVNNQEYLSKAIIELNGNTLALKNFFTNNQIDVNINASDLEIPDNINYIFTEIRMTLTHYIFYSSLISIRQNCEDIIILLTIAFLNIIKICKRYNLEDYIINDFNTLILGEDNPFIKMKEHFYNNPNNDNILLTAFWNAKKLSEEYFDKKQMHK